MSKENTNSQNGYRALLDELHPEPIYRLNQAMISLWKNRKLDYLNGSDEKIAWFVTPYFSSHTRTFHWVNIHPSLWFEGEYTDNTLNAAFEALVDWGQEELELESGHQNMQQTQQKLPKKLIKFFEHLPQDSFFQNARIAFENAIQTSSGKRNIKRTLLAMYSGCHQSADSNIEGVFVRALSNIGHTEPQNESLSLLDATLLGKPGQLFSWLMLESSDTFLKTFQNLNSLDESSDIEPSDDESSYKLKHPDSPETILYHNLLGNIDKFQIELYKRRHVCLIPMYDHWINGYGYGGIKGVLIAFFENKETRRQWKKEHSTTLSEGLSTVASEISQSALTMALSQPIEVPYDLVSHFIKVLAYIQDWESATVVDSNKKIILYQYHRKKIDDVKWNWGLNESIQDNTTCCRSESIESSGDKMFIWWTDDLWSLDLIPSINGDQIARFKHIEICFEFPRATRIPVKSDEPTRKWLRQVYIRQQLGLMQRLIPKIQTRRAALRSAVSAIMGRNMSHNIGSHVLARYSNKAKEDLFPAPECPSKGEQKSDHRGDFFAYLQRRMDFLAEVTTSDHAFWSQPLLLSEQLMRLNYGKQRERFLNSEECKYDIGCTHHRSSGDIIKRKWSAGSPILLSFITGKESLLASVEYGEPFPCPAFAQSRDASFCSDIYASKKVQNDFWFAAPGGDVGIHALFVILENIIRNSARHGSSENGTVRVFVHADDQHEEDLLKLEIIDPRTRLEHDGRMLGSVLSKQNAEDEIEQLGKKHSLYNRDGTRQKLYRLPAEINSILQGEPILSPDGSPTPHYWGLREMQICAHYLRGYPLSDLEGNLNQRPVLQAGIHPLPDSQGYCLKYTIFLQRAKLVAAIIKDDEQKHLQNDLQALDKKGVLLITCNDSPDWSDISIKTLGYEFLLIDQEIDFPTDKKTLAMLPIRTFTYSVENVLSKLKTAAASDLTWMESLYEHLANQCKAERAVWSKKSLWGLDAREYCAREVTSSNWRSVQLDLNQIDNHSNPRGMWPLKDGHKDMISQLDDDEIAAVWIDHPKPAYFTHQRQARTGSFTKFHQAAIPPAGPQPRKRWIHVEPVFHDSPHKDALDNASSLSLYWTLLASAVPRIAVLDERVQSAAHTKIREIPLKTIWPSTGIYVPCITKCNLDTPDLNQVKSFLDKPTDHTEHLPIDFLVIHLTILERLHRDREETEDSFVDTLNKVKSDTQAQKALVIIVTGRGVPTITNDKDPDYLPDVRYLPVSAILEYLVARPSKLGLMRVLWSAGRPVTILTNG